jgi:hypothetical protein
VASRATTAFSVDDASVRRFISTCLRADVQRISEPSIEINVRI